MDREEFIAQDYRRWLLQEFEDRRARNSLYSVRAFSRDLGISKTTLYKVLSRERHLSAKGIKNLEKYAKLTETEVRSIRSQTRRGASKQRCFEIALKCAQRLVDDVGRYSARTRYDLPVVKDLLQNANDVYSELLVQGGDSIDLQLAVAVHGSVSAHAAICSRDFVRAVQLAEEAASSLEKLDSMVPRNSRILSALADAVSQVAYSRELIGHTKDHFRCCEYAAETMARAVEVENTAANCIDLSFYLYNVGRAYAKQGNFEISIDRFNKALGMTKVVPTTHEEGIRGEKSRAYIYRGLSRSHNWIGQYQTALLYAQKSMEHQTAHLDALPLSGVSKVRLVDSLFEHAANCIRLGDDLEGERSLSRMKDVIPELVDGGYDHEFLEGRYYHGIGDLYAARGEYGLAHDSYLQGSQILSRRLREKPECRYFAIIFALIKCQYIKNLLQLGQFKKCLDDGRTLLDLLQTGREGDDHFEEQYLIARVHSLLTPALTYDGRDKNHRRKTLSLANTLQAWLPLFERFPPNQRVRDEFIAWFHSYDTRELLAVVSKGQDDGGPIPEASQNSEVINRITKLLQVIPPL